MQVYATLWLGSVVDVLKPDGNLGHQTTCCLLLMGCNNNDRTVDPWLLLTIPQSGLCLSALCVILFNLLVAARNESEIPQKRIYTYSIWYMIF